MIETLYVWHHTSTSQAGCATQLLHISDLPATNLQCSIMQGCNSCALNAVREPNKRN